MSMFYGAMPRAKKKAGANKFFVDNKTFPQIIALLKTRTEPIRVELVFGDYKTFEPGRILQCNGSVPKCRWFHRRLPCCLLSAIRPIFSYGCGFDALTLLTPPGRGADAVVGTTQRFGIPLDTVVLMPLISRPKKVTSVTSQVYHRPYH